MKTLPDSTLTGKISIKIFGVGGAGCNALSALAKPSAARPKTIALNTDSQCLASCLADEKLCLGAKITYGMGTGGDSELGRFVAENEIEHLKEFCEGANVVFILAGLGGGTGTAASCVLAQAAKDSGAFVLGIVTMPFEFEGRRRARQAQLGLQQLRSVADAVICFPNEKLFKVVNEKDTVTDAFKMANEFLAEGVVGISRLLTQTGLINVDFADVCSVTRSLNSESSFVTVEAGGKDRAQQIVEKLSTHPLLEDGELLENSDALLVNLTGGPDLTMAEVTRLMKEISGRCEKSRIIFGALIEETFADRLSVTLVASGKSLGEGKIVSQMKTTRPTSAPADESETDEQLVDASSTSRPASRIVPPAPEITEEKKEQLFTKQTGSRQKKSRSRFSQNELPLEIISKGRFEKSEPTIHRGEDLDLPTYIRRGIALN